MISNNEENKTQCVPLKYLSEEFDGHIFHSSKVKERVQYFIKAFTKFDPLNIKMIKSIAFYGVPDEIRSLRPIVWRVLLGYFPAEKSKWSEILKSHKEIYESFVSILNIG